MDIQITDGYMPFMGQQTYYRIAGDLHSGKAPLVCLHGGPGSTHNYFEVLDDIARLTGCAVVSYDQVGCGLSGDLQPGQYTLPMWLDELEALREHLGLQRLHILGQSWGGMMILAWLTDRRPAGVQSAILSSTLSSSALWSHEQHRLIALMSAEHQQAIARAEATGDYSDPAYLAANDEYTLRHACHITPGHPEPLRRKKRFGTMAYNAAWGPNEYTPLGNLKEFDYTARLGEIAVPTLVISGTRDESTPLLAKTMADGIAGAQWALLPDARHMTFADQPQLYLDTLASWLAQHEQ